MLSLVVLGYTPLNTPNFEILFQHISDPELQQIIIPVFLQKIHISQSIQRSYPEEFTVLSHRIFQMLLINYRN